MRRVVLEVQRVVEILQIPLQQILVTVVPVLVVHLLIVQVIQILGVEAPMVAAALLFSDMQSWLITPITPIAVPGRRQMEVAHKVEHPLQPLLILFPEPVIHFLVGILRQMAVELHSPKMPQTRCQYQPLQLCCMHNGLPIQFLLLLRALDYLDQSARPFL